MYTVLDSAKCLERLIPSVSRDGSLTPPRAVPFFCRMPLWLHVAVVLFAVATVLAQFDSPFKDRPLGHPENRARVGRIHQDELRQFAGDTNRLVLPGLIADRRKQRVEVRVERSAVGANASCEFLVVSESSDHGYESLLIAFARPSDIHAALRFIGTEPGESYHPPTHRFWAKGERFQVSVIATNGNVLRVENLLMDRRTGTALPPEGFLFTGSRRIPAPDNPHRLEYVADTVQPMAIACLFSTPYAVLEVPRTVSKETIYRNTTVNPDFKIAEGALLTLAIEPVLPLGSKSVQDLVLQIDAAPGTGKPPGSKVEALANLRVQLREGSTVLNPDGTLVSAVIAIAALDRQKRIPFLTLHWSPAIQLASVQALAEILDSLDSEQGIRIEPPLPGEPYYRAFTPDRQLLNRTERRAHPPELALHQKDGRISGHLLLVESVRREGTSGSELECIERPLLDSADLGRELEADRERHRSPNRRPRPNVLLAFVPPDLTLGQLTTFLKPALTNQTAIHLLLDEPMPPAPPKPSAP